MILIECNYTHDSHFQFSEFSDEYFTHVIIDEAAQCNECEAMVPITCMKLKDGQVIMAGDPLQLPPISLSDHARNRGMVMSMLARYIDMYNTMEGIEAVCDQFIHLSSIQKITLINTHMVSERRKWV